MPYTIKRLRNMKSMYGGAIYWQFLTTYMQVSVKPIFSIAPKGRSCKICKSLHDITSGITYGPGVWQIFKIRTVRKPDNFRPGRLLKIEKILENPIFFKIFLSKFFLFIYLVQELLTPNLCPGTLSTYENLRSKMWCLKFSKNARKLLPEFLP